MKKYFILIAIAGFTLTSCTTRVVTTAPASRNVVVVKKAPQKHRVVVVKGQRYYVWNNTYHRKTANGYVVVRVR